MADRVLISDSADRTFQIGVELGTELKRFVAANNKGFKLGFKGTLGAGKTLMIKGILSVICPKEVACSPSFTIVNEYSCGEKRVLHADLYRVYAVEELFGTGFLEAMDDENSMMLVEWVDHLPDMEAKMVIVEIEPNNDNTRKVTIKNWSKKL